MEVAKEEHDAADASHEKARAALVEEVEELRGERRIQLKKMEEQQRLAAQLRVQVCLSTVCAGVYCRSIVDQLKPLFGSIRDLFAYAYDLFTDAYVFSRLHACVFSMGLA